MGNAFRYTFISLVRDWGVLVWALLFPLVLATMFWTMFANIDYDAFGRDISLLVVDNEEWDAEESSSLRETLEALAKPGTATDGNSSLLQLTAISPSVDRAQALYDSDAIAVLSIDDEGNPQLFMKHDPTDSMITMRQTVLQTIIENAQSTQAVVTDAVVSLLPEHVLNDSSMAWNWENIQQMRGEFATTPEMEQLVSSFTERAERAATREYVGEVSITQSDPNDFVRYYYALLGMAALMGGNAATVAMSRTIPYVNELGARRCLGATTRSRTLFGSFGASWLIAFLCLVIAFLYIRIVLRVDFGGKDLACIGALAVSSLMASALGYAVGALPHLSEGVKGGILTGIACITALFAGMYGTACMELADSIARNAPALAALNPARQISQSFYSLYYYDSLEPYIMVVVMLLAMAAVFLIVALLLSRRQRYAHL